MKKIFVSDVSLKVASMQETALTFREKLAVAEKLDLALVDAIELPLLCDSKENEVICRTIASAVKGAMIKIPVGDNEECVKASAECIKGAVNPCLQVSMPISTAQMEYFYHLKAPAMQGKIEQLIKFAKTYCEQVEFVAKDAFRAEEGFLEACVKTAVQAGATSVTITDETGEALPEDFESAVKNIKAICDVKVLVQPMDSLSLSVACAISAIKAGADGVKTSSFGEYLSLAKISSLIKAKKYNLDVECGVDTTKAKTISCEIGAIAEGDTINEKAPSNVIECTSNAKEIAEIVKQLGYELSDVDNGKVYEEFKKVTAKKQAIDAKELEAIVASTAMQVPSTYHLVNFFVNSGNTISATANITLEKDGEKITGVSTGDGPIDAAFHAIEQVIGHHYELDDFQVHAVTKGRGAVGSSLIRLRANGKLYPGNGVSTDIVGACIRAYINALNKIVYEGD
jgi:2-isopropylmalate synthase